MKTRTTKTILMFLLLLAVAMPRLLAQTGSAFYIENGGNLRLTNNIIVNNGGDNLNITTPTHNLTDNGNDIFMDVTEDFRPGLRSPAIDAGLTTSVTWEMDLDDSIRVVNGLVDLGAYESAVTTLLRQFAIHQIESGSLTLCNNIVINNPVHTSAINRDDIPSVNILTDDEDVFRDPLYDFTLYPTSPAVNAGQNSCNALPIDLQDKHRIVANIIDLGAFEHYSETFTTESVFIVARNDGVNLTLCNNIDINNSVYAANTNVTGAESSNIFTDNDSLFVDPVENFMPREGSEAIDHGLDECNSVGKDLADNDRIMGSCIDIGAYEQYVEDTTTTNEHFAVHQMNTGTLMLCNNIIVNNPAHDAMVNIEEVPGNNILSDSVSLFCDPYYNFKPYNGSPAVDAGRNACNNLRTDIDTVTRILGAAIEVGAFEVPVKNDDISGGGDGGGGSGGGDGDNYGYNHFIVHQYAGDTLYLCNNIVINNCVYAANITPRGDTINNIFTDNDSLFVDPIENYLPRAESIAVNEGENGCNSVDIDLKGEPRIAQNVIDIGAYEQFIEEVEDTLPHTYVLHETEGGHLILCNNIIVNNPAHTALSNLDEIPAYNIVSDSLDLFRDSKYDFSLWANSAAVNAGNNTCCSLGEDIANEQRIIADTIDVGAFEFKMFLPETDTVYIVSKNSLVELELCNNIVINNCDYAINTNILNAPSNNILEDNDSIFTDNETNYFPLPESIAINTGENDCNSLDVDLAKHPRIMANIIDIGAYEQFIDEQDTLVLAAVHEVDTLHHLYLYNNIVINNPGHAQNYIGRTTGSHNMLEDTPDVFVDITSNYLLMQGSPAIDAGDNQYVSWEFDLKEDARISCANIVDQGAYEYSFNNVATALTATEITADNCQGSYILLQATPGAQHYYWSHTNEDTNEVVVMPFVSTNYTVIASNGGECVDTTTIHVIPSVSLADSLGTPSSIGKVFWFSYLKNHFRTPTLTVQISAERACSGTVTNPRTGWGVPFSVGAHSVTTVTIPNAHAYPEEADNVGDYGILVESDDSVSVYAANYNSNSFDVTDVLPINALADEYLLQTYTPMMNAEFVVIATEDNTVVEITPSKALQGGHNARQTFSVTLQRGQTYLGLSRYGGTMGDLSGTIIKSLHSKPIAVFNGNVCALVPATNSYTDHLVEQAMGVKYWGRSFALTSTQGQNFDVVRVTALRNNTEIRKNDELLSTIQAGETYEFQWDGSEVSAYLETSNPAGVYLYIAGAVGGNDQEMSDPSMIWIPPVEQKMSDLTFATFDSPGIASHYVNIVVPLASLDDITLDGLPIGSQFTPLTGNPQFAFVKRRIRPGTHQLLSAEGFIAHVYGLGYHESYGYAAGSKAVPLREQLFVNDVLSSDLPADQYFCQYEPIDFRVEVNYACDSVLWDFGDSSAIVNAFSSTHAYETGGNYTVTATLYITNGESVFCTNLYTRIRITEGLTETYYDTVCQGVLYTEHGFEIMVDEAGHFVHTRTVELENQYCDSTYILELEVRDNHRYIFDTICENNLYSEFGFHITASEPGTIRDSLVISTSSGPCDSIVFLTLLVTPNTENIPEIAGETYPCIGETFTYALDSLSGLQEIAWTIPDSVIVWEQTDDYHITLVFETYAETYEIAATGHNRCGDTTMRKMLYPQNYSYIQITDTICSDETHYEGYGFVVDNVSDTNDLFYHHDVTVRGCDSTTILALVRAPLYHTSDTVTLCDNEFPYSYHDTLIPTAGTHDITLLSQWGCDSVVSLTILTLETHQITMDSIVCNALVWNDSIYTYSGDYIQRFTNQSGCDSIVTIRLTVNYSDTSRVDSSVCRNELPILWNNVSFNEAGTQQVTLQTYNGCDSVVIMTLHILELTEDTLSLTIVENQLPYTVNTETYDSAGTYIQHLLNEAGCDSTLTIHLTVLYNAEVMDEDTVCEGDLPFEWNGVTFTEAGSQVATLTATNGVDSIVVMNLTVIPTTYGTLDTLVLENDLPITLNDERYSEEGTYEQTLTNTDGCDSALTVTVTVLYNVTTNADSVLCERALPFTWNGVNFTEAGTQSVTLTAVNGVDSTVMMTLTVIPTTYGILDTTVLENNLPITLNDESYSGEGTYEQSLSNSEGCDSILTVNVTVLYNVTTEASDSICDNELPYTWNGITFTTQGTQDATLTAANGVDSTVVMTLTVTPTYNVTDSVTVCESQTPYTWNGVNFTEAGTQTIVLQSVNGCDSTVVMTLTIIPTTYGTVDTLVLENDLPVTLNGESYTGEGTHTQTLTNAESCDSILTVTITVLYNVTNSIDSTLCEDELPITWNGTEFTASGTQSATLTAANGVDSTVVMTLTVIPTTYGTLDTTVIENNLPLSLNGESYSETGTYIQDLVNVHGCDSVLTVNVTVFYNVTAEAAESICDNELPFTWNGVTFTEAGTQETVLTAANGVDSTVVMTLTVIPTTYGTIDITVLENDLPLTLNNESFTGEGTYTQILPNAEGCDSILTVNVTVLHNVTSLADTSLCESELPFTWNGVTFSSAGTQNAILTAANGVDSTVVMTLTVISTTYGTTNITVIENDLPVSVNGTTYSSEGSFTQHLENADGCDSVLTVNVTVLYNVTTNADSVVCDNLLPFTWNGVTFTEAGIQEAVLTATNGVDSTVVMNLTVPPTYNVTTDSTICESSLPFTWNGVEFTEGGTQTIVLQSVNGCDSTVTMNLSLHYTDNTEISEIACDSYDWNGISYDESGDYTQILTDMYGCDSVVILHLTIHPTYQFTDSLTICESDLPYTYQGITFEEGTPAFSTTDFSFTTEYGCDSILTLALTVTPNVYVDLNVTVLENDLPYLFYGTSYNNPGTYIYHSVTEAGCDSTLTLHLNVLFNVTVEIEKTLCSDDLPHVWNGVSFTGAGTQSTTLTAANGVDSTVVMTLHSIDNSLEVIMLTDDPCADFTADLLAQTEMTNLIWSTGETTPQITVTHSGTYYVTASEGGCVATGQIFVPVCEFELYLPNAITPTDLNGINDYFYVPQYSQRQINEFDITIYNRWGQMIFHSEDKHFRWHGDYNGKVFHNMTYSYVIKYTDYNGKAHLRTGSITVL